MVLPEEWARAGCAAEFLDRPMSDDPHDHLLLQIRGAMAEYERTLIAERRRRGRLAKLRAGALLPWTCAPYGYRMSPDRPRDPAEAAVVAELLAWYRQPGTSLRGSPCTSTHAACPRPGAGRGGPARRSGASCTARPTPARCMSSARSIAPPPTGARQRTRSAARMA